MKIYEKCVSQESTNQLPKFRSDLTSTYLGWTGDTFTFWIPIEWSLFDIHVIVWLVNLWETFVITWISSCHINASNLESVGKSFFCWVHRFTIIQFNLDSFYNNGYTHSHLQPFCFVCFTFTLVNVYNSYTHDDLEDNDILN